LTDRELFESVECKIQAVEAFVKRHDPDIVFTIAGMNSEAESFGAKVLMKENGSQYIAGSPLSDRPDPSHLIPMTLHSSPLCTALIDSIRMLSERLPDKLVAASLNGPLTVLGQLLGLDRLLLLSVDNPHLMQKLLSPITKRIIEFMNAQIEVGARYVHVAEPAGSLLSPNSFREINLPVVQELFSHVNVPNHLHICGDVNAHLKVLAQTGAGAISVDSMVDMKAAAGILANEMAVCGNIESAGVLLNGSSAQVKSATLSMLEQMDSIDNYIPASSCGIPRQTPPENIETFVSTVRTHKIVAK
jgi:uroporphyrinogen decarboxylase